MGLQGNMKLNGTSQADPIQNQIRQLTAKMAKIAPSLNENQESVEICRLLTATRLKVNLPILTTFSTSANFGGTFQRQLTLKPVRFPVINNIGRQVTFFGDI